MTLGILAAIAALPLVVAPARMQVTKGAAAAPPGYALEWADEFDRDGPPDPANWGFEGGFVRNDELQWYQPENARVVGGELVIEARRERKKNPSYQAGSDDWGRSREFVEYTSASLTSEPMWQYGRIEMRGRIDTRAGMWPAFWTMGKSRGWPRGGEVDVMEYYQGTLRANLAWGSTRPGRAAWSENGVSLATLGPDWSNQFHVWRMDWDADHLRLFVDNRLMNDMDLSRTVNGDGTGFNPFHQPHYLLLSLAIGGDNGGDPSASTFPARFEVDYVRVYRRPTAPIRPH